MNDRFPRNCQSSLLSLSHHPSTAAMQKKSSLAFLPTSKTFSLVLLQQLPSVFLALIGLGISTVAPVWAEPSSVQQFAQVPPTQNAPTTVIYVSSSTGNDSGAATEQSPLQTITQALRVAQAGTAIILAPGTYSEQTGEQFPLMLKPNVTLQGNPSAKGQNIVITGGGTFTSRTFASQNITVLGANGAKVSGVTITNPNPRGYGLWIESSSLIVSNNTFTGNVHDGISVVGMSAPLIQENYFSQNGANGITVFGESRPEIRNNEFDNTGFAINIAHNAAPFVIGNRIFRNKDGIVIQANAKPVLRENFIEENQRDGIVAIAQSLPDIGTPTQPGHNVIRNNGRYDLNNGTKGQIILAHGNQLSPNKVVGSVEVAGNYTAASPAPLVRQALTPIASPNSPQVASTSEDSSAVSPINTAASLPVYLPESNSVPQPVATRTPPPAPPTPAPTAEVVSAPPTPAPTAEVAIPIPVPPPESPTVSSLPPRPQPPQPQTPTSSNPDTASSLVSLFSRLVLNRPAPVNIPVPPPVSQRPNSSPAPIIPPVPTNVSAASSGILPVPGPNIPLGSGGGELPGEVNVYATGPSLAPLSPAALGLRYRVVVEGTSDREYQRVRSVIPEAFRTVLNGRQIIQAGAFRDRYRADQVVRDLNRSGVRAKIELMN